MISEEGREDKILLGLASDFLTIDKIVLASYTQIDHKKEETNISCRRKIY